MVENMEAKKSSGIKSRPVSRPATITIHLPDGTIVEKDAMVSCPSSEDRDRVTTETLLARAVENEKEGKMDNILDRINRIKKAFTTCCDGKTCWECSYGNTPSIKPCMMIQEDVLLVLRALQSELAKVTAERDAAMADVRRECATCALCSQNNKTGEMCEWAFNCNQIDGYHWEWRGVQNDENIIYWRKLAKDDAYFIGIAGIASTWKLESCEIFSRNIEFYFSEDVKVNKFIIYDNDVAKIPPDKREIYITALFESMFGRKINDNEYQILSSGMDTIDGWEYSEAVEQ